MSKLLVRSLILLAGALCLSSPLWSQGSINIKEVDGRTSSASRRNLLHPAVPLLSIAPDSRSAGMGDVGAATQPDVNSQHWNVAKYSQIKTQWGIAVSYIPWLRKLTNEINLAYLAGYYRIDEWQSVSASLRYFSMGQMTFTNDQGVALQTHNPNEFAIDVGYSRNFLENLSGGIIFRFIRSDLTGGFSQTNTTGSARAGMSYAADIGLYYDQPFKIRQMNAEYAVGLAITNIGSKLTYNDVYKNFIPTTLRIGGRFTINFDSYNKLSTNLDLSKLLIPTPPEYDSEGNIVRGKNPDVSVVTGMIQSFYDAPGGFKEEIHEINMGIGLEYVYANQFSVRAGYFYEHATKGGRKYFTIGAGFNYNIFGLDLAYLIPSAGFNSPMANTVRFTLMVNMNPPDKKKRRVKRKIDES